MEAMNRPAFLLLALALSSCATSRPTAPATAQRPFWQRLGVTGEHLYTGAAYVAAETLSTASLATISLSGPTITIRLFDLTFRQPAPLKMP
jgi:hypothetical protein